MIKTRNKRGYAQLVTKSDKHKFRTVILTNPVLYAAGYYDNSAIAMLMSPLPSLYVVCDASFRHLHTLAEHLQSTCRTASVCKCLYRQHRGV